MTKRKQTLKEAIEAQKAVQDAVKRGIEDIRKDREKRDAGNGKKR